MLYFFLLCFDQTNIFQGVGEYTEIEITPERTCITFKDRFTAEKFMYNTPGSEIPSVGKVEMTWISSPLPPINLANLAATATAAAAKPKTDSYGDGDLHMDDANANMTSSPARATGGQQEEGDNVDYDVADDNDWGVE